MSTDVALIWSQKSSTQIKLISNSVHNDQSFAAVFLLDLLFLFQFNGC